MRSAQEEENLRLIVVRSISARQKCLDFAQKLIRSRRGGQGKFLAAAASSAWMDEMEGHERMKGREFSRNFLEQWLDENRKSAGCPNESERAKTASKHFKHAKLPTEGCLSPFSPC